MVLGALEAGGTKMVCAIGNEKGEILDRISIPTKEPDTTLPEILEYFKKHKVEALGIACFGPIDPVTEKNGRRGLRPERGIYGINQGSGKTCRSSNFNSIQGLKWLPECQ